jgi:DNA polymerase-3 subunit gamma/tau
VPASRPAEQVRPGDKKSFPGTISIKNTPASKAEEPGHAETASLVTDDTLLPVSPFTREQLENAWNEFALEQKSGSIQLFNLLRNHMPVLRENYLIEIPLDNKIQEEEFNQKRNELTARLFTKLDNQKISIQVVIRESTHTTRPYTDKEKFARMAEKNPALKDLKEQLDLGID